MEAALNHSWFIVQIIGKASLYTNDFLNKWFPAERINKNYSNLKYQLIILTILRHFLFYKDL